MIFRKDKSEHKDEKVDISVDSIFHGHHQATYRGVKAIKCPFDYLMYQMIVFEVNPDLIIEIGSNMGGGSLYLADLLKIRGKGVLHTIDIVDQIHPQVKEHDRIKFFREGWVNYDLSKTDEFKKILVIEDSSHEYNNTLGVMEKFGPIVSKDSYLIIEDGIINELGLEKDYSGGPLKAIREFLPKHPEFLVDKKWCNMFGQNATFNVNGYLKKIK